MKVKVLQNILDANDQIAARNQELLDRNNVLALNIMSSPGAGKTSLIMETIKRLKGRVRMAVIEGDIASTIDADRRHILEWLPLVRFPGSRPAALDALVRFAGDEPITRSALDILSVGGRPDDVAAIRNAVVTTTDAGHFPRQFLDAAAVFSVAAGAVAPLSAQAAVTRGTGET